MKIIEEVFDSPYDIDFYGEPIKYYFAAEKFEVDGIIYDPTSYEKRGNINRSMIDLLPC